MAAVRDAFESGGYRVIGTSIFVKQVLTHLPTIGLTQAAKGPTQRRSDPPAGAAGSPAGVNRNP
jgi:hypothetical protein